MHTIKGGWVGQTFALAKGNESGGKKSRVRRSKEERKEMVESFIEKYQSLNNGNFPSLNLTHKEVGGSFYTVREIVREIIQENRVLGPAKLLPAEHNTDQSLEQYPLGTISTKPQTFFISQNGSPVVIDQHHNIIEEPQIITDGLSSEFEHKIDNGQIINVSRVSVVSDQSDKPKVAEVVASKLVEAKRSAEKVASSKVTRMADVVVETFPIRPVTMSTDFLDKNSCETRYLNGTLEEKGVYKVPVASGKDSILEAEISSAANDKLVEKSASTLLETKSDLVDVKAAENLKDPAGNSISSATEQGYRHDIDTGIDVESNSSLNFKATAETRDVNAPSNVQTKTVNGSSATVGNRSSKSITQEVEIKNKPDVQCTDDCQKGSNATLDRINLESWQGASRNPAKPEMNPLWAIFKSFMTTFVKFWIE